jgi:hypothetical protein
LDVFAITVVVILRWAGQRNRGPRSDEAAIGLHDPAVHPGRGHLGHLEPLRRPVTGTDIDAGARIRRPAPTTVSAYRRSSAGF